MARRFLKKDGVLIYRGGSDKSVISIPDILKNAGFPNAIKKELNPDHSNTQRDNGSISLASNVEIKLLKKNFLKLPEITQYYLNYYKFFSLEPFSIDTNYLLKKIKLDRSNSITDFSIFQSSKKISSDGLVSQKEKDISKELIFSLKNFSICNQNTG